MLPLLGPAFVSYAQQTQDQRDALTAVGVEQVSERPARHRRPDEVGGAEVEGRRAVLELLRAGKRERAAACGCRRVSNATPRSTRSSMLPARSCAWCRRRVCAPPRRPTRRRASSRACRTVALGRLRRAARGSARVPRRARRRDRSAQSRRDRARCGDRGRHRDRDAEASQRAGERDRGEDRGRCDRVRARSRWSVASPPRSNGPSARACGASGSTATRSRRSPTCRSTPSRSRWCSAPKGSGLAALTKKRCDALAAIPMHGRVQSLNVAAAAAVACHEIARRRSSRHRGDERT